MCDSCKQTGNDALLEFLVLDVLVMYTLVENLLDLSVALTPEWMRQVE